MLSASSANPWRMSPGRSMPGPSLMSELIHPGSGCPPQPQLSRLTSTAWSWKAASCCCAAPSLISNLGYPKRSQESRQNEVGVEVLLRQRARGSAVQLVVRGDARHAFDGLLEGGVRDEPFACGIQLGEAGVLGKHGLSGGEIADAAIAEPAAS